MRLVDRFDRFDLDHHLPVDDEIQPVETDGNPQVADADGKLSLIEDPSPIEFDAQRFLIDVLEEARSNLLVDGDGGSVDLACHLAMEVGGAGGH